MKLLILANYIFTDQNNKKHKNKRHPETITKLTIECGNNNLNKYSNKEFRIV